MSVADAVVVPAEPRTLRAAHPLALADATEVLGFPAPLAVAEPVRAWWQRKRYLGIAASLAAASLVAALAWHSSGSPRPEAQTTQLPPVAATSQVPQAAGPSPTSQPLDAAPTTADDFARVIMTAIGQERSATYTHDLEIPQGTGVSQSSGRLRYTPGGSTDYDTTVTYMDPFGSTTETAHALIVGNKAYASGPATVPYSETDIGPSATLTSVDPPGAWVARDARWVSFPYNFQELLDNATRFAVSDPSPGVLALHGSVSTDSLSSGPTGGLFQEVESAPTTDFTLTLDNATYLPSRLEMTFVVPDLGSAYPATATATYASWGDDQGPISPPPCGVYGGADSPVQMYCD